MRHIHFPPIVLVIGMVILGLAVRLAGPLTADFPLNDGGLFYQMARDLQNNDHRLPIFSTYNGGEIPFAYPPLAFYFYAILQQLSGISLLDLMRILPALISGLTILAFYWLARELAPDETHALWATLAFALLPRSFDWHIMGGGLTRAPGLLLALLALWRAWRLFVNPTLQNTALLALFTGLTALTHPEGLAHVVLSGMFFYIWKSRTPRGALYGLLAGLGGAILSSPWWLTVLTRHGVSPFFAALSAARADSLPLLLRPVGLLQFDFTDERILPLFAVLGLIGLLYLLAQSRMALPLWFVSLYLLEPRSGTLYMMIPLSLAVAVALQDVLRPALSPSRFAWTLLIGLTVLYGAFNALRIATHVADNLSLSSANRAAFEWIRTHTPETSRFLLLTGRHPLNDSVSEWFPALTARQSLLTVFGAEWRSDTPFEQRLVRYRILQQCQQQGLECLEREMAGLQATHIYLETPSLLTEQLAVSSRYRPIYHKGPVLLLERLP